MREIVSLQFGQCGNQVGQQLWETILSEHGQYVTAASSTFFWESPRDDKFYARAVLVDMEEGVLSQIKRSALGHILRDDQYISGTDGSGNNFCEGYRRHGDERIEGFLEQVRRELEKCESPQAFYTVQSTGGGTGSGLGTRLIEALERYRLQTVSAAIYPGSQASDVITAPYNTVLASAGLIQAADLVLPFDNGGVFDYVNAKRQNLGKGGQKLIKTLPKEPSMLDLFRDFTNTVEKTENPEKQKKKEAFRDVNRTIASTLSSICCSMRFGGELNVDLNEIATNLVPFSGLNIGLVNYNDYANIPLGHRIKSTLSGRACSLSVGPGDQEAPKTLWDGVCANLLLCRDPEVDSGLFAQAFEAAVRGGAVPPEQNFKTGLSAGGVDRKRDLCFIRNGKQSSEVLNAAADAFKRLRDKKMYLHHYLKFMELDEIDQRYEVVRDVTERYKLLGSPAEESQTATKRAQILQQIQHYVF